MISLTPHSNGEALREFNQCHSPNDGKFCSAPGAGGAGDNAHTRTKQRKEVRMELNRVEDAALHAITKFDKRLKSASGLALMFQAYDGVKADVMNGKASYADAVRSRFNEPLSSSILKHVAKVPLLMADRSPAARLQRSRREKERKQFGPGANRRRALHRPRPSEWDGR